jgi:hypothetical protein
MVCFWSFGNIFRPFGIFRGHLVKFVVIWYVLPRNNLATLRWCEGPIDLFFILTVASGAWQASEASVQGPRRLSERNLSENRLPIMCDSCLIQCQRIDLHVSMKMWENKWKPEGSPILFTWDRSQIRKCGLFAFGLKTRFVRNKVQSSDVFGPNCFQFSFAVKSRHNGWHSGWPDAFVKKGPKCSPAHFLQNNT